MKRKILMVSCQGLGKGGVQSVMMNIVRSLSNEFDFDMLLFTNKRRFYDDEFETYGKIFRISTSNNRMSYYSNFFRILVRTYKVLKQGKYGVIHCNNNYEGGICLLAAKMAGVPIRIMHSHGIHKIKDLHPTKRIIAAVYKMLLNRCSTQRVACSQVAGESLFTKDFDVILNPINVEKFVNNKKAKLSDEIRFIHVGKFYETKNQVFAINTFSKIKETFPKSKFTFVGVGEEYLYKMEKQIDRLNLKDSVEILPENADVPSLMKESEYMIFPSLHEGLGIALIEAQAANVFCFVSDSVPKEADAGMCQFLTLDDGADVWADNIVDFIKNNKKAQFTSDMSRFDLHIICNKVARIYENV